jgi:hypothetical protein
MTKAATLAALAVAAGFLVGLAWGQGTRRELPGATATSFDGGKLTVQVDTYQALTNGLLSALK